MTDTARPYRANVIEHQGLNYLFLEHERSCQRGEVTYGIVEESPLPDKLISGDGPVHRRLLLSHTPEIRGSVRTNDGAPQ